MKAYSFVESGCDEEVDEIYLNIKNTFGVTFVPNFFKVLAHHKFLLQGVWNCYEKVLASGDLPLQVKEVIFLYTALENGCNYCSSTHLAVCDMLEFGEDNILALKNDIDKIRPKELQAVLSLVKKVLHAPESINKNDYHELSVMGFSDSEVAEMLCMIHLAKTAVRIALMNGLSDIEPEISEYLKNNSLSTGIA